MSVRRAEAEARTSPSRAGLEPSRASAPAEPSSAQRGKPSAASSPSPPPARPVGPLGPLGPLGLEGPGLEGAALQALLAAHPELSRARPGVLRELAAAGRRLQLEASEWPGFVSGLLARHGSLEHAALVLGETQRALEQRLARTSAPAHETHDIIAHTDDLTERSAALSALAAARRQEVVSEWGADLRRELGLAAARPPAPGDLSQARAAQGRLASARAAREAAERRLGKQLALRGALLTPPQRLAFIAAFQELEAPRLTAEARAADALAAALEACRLPPAALVPAYAALAASPRAEDALRWASRLATSNPALAADERLVAIASTALEHAAAGLALRADSPAKATSSIEALLAPFLAASRLEGRVDSVATLVKELGEKNERAIASAVQAGLKKNPLRRAMQIAALAVALTEAASNVERERLLAALGSLASAGALGIAVLTPAAWRVAAVAHELGYPAAELHLWRLNGVGATASSALLSLSALTAMSEQLKADDLNAGTYLTVAGTALCATGSALSALGVGELWTGVGAPLGGGHIAVASVATAAGALLAELGSALDDSIRGDALAEEARGLLEAANARLSASGQRPVDPELLRLLTAPDVDAARAAPLELEGAALQTAALAVPELLALPTGLVEALGATAADLGLDDDERIAFLVACRRKYGSLEEAARRLGDERSAALAPPVAEPSLAQERAELFRRSDDPDVRARELAELVRRRNEARRSSWARATRARFGLAPPSEAPDSTPPHGRTRR